jgi:hypothetical protein
MKFILRLLFVIVCFSAVAFSQIENIYSFAPYDQTFIPKNRIQFPENQSIKKFGKDFRNFVAAKKKNSLQKSNSTIFKPLSIVTDNRIDTYTYDKSGNVLLLKIDAIEEGVKTNYRIDSTYYEDNGTKKIVIIKIFQGGQLRIGRFTYVYDNSGNNISYLSEVWNDSLGKWVNISRDLYTYDNNLIIQIHEVCPDSVSWVNAYRYTSKYDNSGNITEDLSEVWENNTWFLQQRNFYTYDKSGNVLTQGYDRRAGDIWETISLQTMTYDNSGHILTQLEQYNSGGAIVNNAIYIWKYNENGDLISELYKIWGSTDWDNIYKDTYTYDASNHRIGKLEEEWIDSSWVNSRRFAYNVNSSGKVISEIFERWKDSTWAVSSKSLFGYDAYGNTTHVENYDWQDSTWVPCLNEIIISFNNGQDELWYVGTNADVEYAAFSVTGIEEKQLQVSEYNLAQNYPNPFNPATRISYSLPKESFVTLKVYNSLGEEITTLVNESKPAGRYTTEFNGSNLSSGVYIYRIQAGTFSNTKKLLLLK